MSDTPSPPPLPPELVPPDEPDPHRARAGAKPLLVLLGLVFLACAFSSGAFAFVDRHLGFARAAAAALGFLFLYVAWLSWQQGRLRGRFLDLMEEVLKVFYGSNFRRERQAVDILVRALETDNEAVRRSAREHLVRLTGVDRGDDGAAWAAWWSEHRSTFRARRPGDGDT